MTLKELYESDLLTRFPGYSFTETVVGDSTLVEFKDGVDALVFECKKPAVGDAYKEIRENVVGFAFEVPLYGPGQWVVLTPDALQTTDETITNISALTLVDDSVLIVKAIVIAIEDDGSDRGGYEYEATVYRNGGDATLEGSTSIIHEGFSDSNWKVYLEVSGNDFQVNVEGVSAETINWECTLHYMSSN